MLYIVPTPIGNLQDITLRALDVLRAADFILCEDTRQTRKLLDAYNISTRPLRYNENDASSINHCLNMMKEGKNCALVSDAGTPCISDPGWKLARMAMQEGIKVTALPGASAVTCALSGSGLGGGGFTFLGFIARKKGKIIKALNAAFGVEKPVVVYESPYRVIKFLELVAVEFGPEVKTVIAREISKTFEEYISGTVSEVLENLKARKKILGEFVVILDRRNAEQEQEDEVQDE